MTKQAEITAAEVAVLKECAKKCCTSCSIGAYLYKHKDPVFDWMHVSGTDKA